MLDDAALLRRYAQSRDAEAFSALICRHGGLVYGTCLRVLRNRQLAEDAAQESFLALAGHAGEIRHSLAAWLHTVAMHAAQRLLSRQREQLVPELPEPSAPDAVVESWRLLVPRLDDALASLPPDLRTVISMRFLAGHSQTDIAQALQVSQATISRRLEAGIRALRCRLAADLEAFDDQRLAQALVLMPVALPASVAAHGAKIAVLGIGAPLVATAAGSKGLLIALLAVGLLLLGAVGLTLGLEHRHAAVNASAALAAPAQALPAAPRADAPTQASDTPPPAAPASAALAALPITACVHQWPLDRVIELLQEDLPIRPGPRGSS